MWIREYFFLYGGSSPPFSFSVPNVLALNLDLDFSRNSSSHKIKIKRPNLSIFPIIMDVAKEAPIRKVRESPGSIFAGYQLKIVIAANAPAVENAIIAASGLPAKKAKM